jgi:alkanesulfonate monooxygenase SsuD/methylene tetrahydromethanopterin reductase-like flavin-dependent oxidoreductase (luciferase family)
MEFSAMTLNMFFPDYQSLEYDHETILLATQQSIWLAELGFNPWYTDHHFRGPWHSNPIQFAAYIAPQIPPERYIGFGVLSAPFYHPVRLVESMNLLDQLTKGKTLFGLGSGWQGAEAEALGIDKEYHASGRAAEDTLDVMQRLWKFRTGDPEYSFEVGGNRGTIKRRVMPAPYGKRHPVIIRTASREAGLLKAAQNGWPAFLGIFGGDMRGQARQYRAALAAAGHSQDVIEECLRWCTADWLSVVVAPTDAEAQERALEAWTERMDIRRRYIAIHGKLDGPVIRLKPGQSLADEFASGGDMKEILAGSPDTIAAKVQEIADLGVNHLMVRFLGEYAGKTRPICEMSAELFAREVAPRFTDIPPLRDPLAIDLA